MLFVHTITNNSALLTIFAPMLRIARNLFIILIIALLSSSCSDYQKILKNPDPAFKLEKATEYFTEGDYFRALQLLDELVIIYRGRPEAEQISYYYSYCYYHQKQYLLASYNFKDFVRSYPTSSLAEECMYMNAYCKYLMSPKFSLDQQSTYDAIRELQLFTDLFPQSSRVASCNDLMDQLRAKIEKKDFETAKLYYTTEYYTSAIFALNQFVKSYPSTTYREEALALLVKAHSEYAFGSVPGKQKERYEATIEAAKAYISTYPDGKWAGQVKSIERDARKWLGI
jgi:outer membrane protein assembly factor BamD